MVAGAECVTSLKVSAAAVALKLDRYVLVGT